MFWQSIRTRVEAARLGGCRGRPASARRVVSSVIVFRSPLRYRNVKAILFDSPPAIEEANRRINGDGLAKRYEVTVGDFFQSVPRGGDAYVLKNILHDWNDADCITILKNCHSAMAEHGKVLLVETVKTANGEPFDSLLDLNMLVISRGRERSEAEYRALLDEAGLKLTKVIPTVSPLSVIEAVRQ